MCRSHITMAMKSSAVVASSTIDTSSTPLATLDGAAEDNSNNDDGDDDDDDDDGDRNSVGKTVGSRELRREDIAVKRQRTDEIT